MSKPQSNPTEMYPIGTVAALTGVKAVTLRAWERRYGVIEPARTATGRRLYTREQIDRVNRVLSLLDRGVAIGQASRSLGPAPVAAARDAWSQVRERMIDAASRFDEGALDEAYNEALGLYPLDVVTRRLLMPLLEELGRRWETAEGSVAEEHFFATYVRNKLGARFHHRPRLTSGPRLLVACAPGEHHEIGALLFGLAAHDAGLQTILLGADTPFDQMALACRRAGCDAIAVSCSFAAGNEFLRELTELAASVQAPVFVGGRAATTHRDAIARTGAIALGPDIDLGVRRIVVDLNSEQDAS